MELQIFDHQSLDTSAWDTLVRHQPLFRSKKWVEICCACLDKKAYAIYLCIYDDEKLVAGLPAIITSRYGFKSFLSMPFGTYGGVIWADGVTTDMKQKCFARLDEFFKKAGFARIIITDFWGDMNGWKNDRFDRTKLSTHVIDLNGLKEYQVPNRSVRVELRLGQEAGGQIIRIQKSEEVDHFYRLFEMTERRHGRKSPRYSKKFFTNFADVFLDDESVYWVGVTDGEQLIGSQINLIFGDTMFFWQSGSDYRKKKCRPHYLLFYAALCRAVELGIKKVNLGASPAGASGLVYFKERWGGRQVEYDAYSYRSRWLRMVGR